MPATRMMIARRAGVSVATVDRVLRDDQAVRPETSETRLCLTSVAGSPAPEPVAVP